MQSDERSVKNTENLKNGKLIGQGLQITQGSMTMILNNNQQSLAIQRPVGRSGNMANG